MDILEVTKYKCSVSTVLNKDVKQHGKQYMFDAEEDTAWSSSEGTPQWIALQFEEPQSLGAFSFQFQGGFVGTDAKVIIEANDGRIIGEEKFYPEDVNSIQKFEMKTPITEKIVVKLKFVFGASTDFFGRIIIYKLKLYK